MTDKVRDARLPKPGSTLARKYKGADVQVHVLDDGFEWDGMKYASLSQCAKAITGHKEISGFMFFKLGEPAVKRPRKPKTPA